MRRKTNEESAMITLKHISQLTLAIGSCVVLTTPALAQYSIKGEQPAVGQLHQQEAQLQAQLDDSYVRGLIDSFELANLTRDLDAIRVKEEDFRMRAQGMSPKAFARVEKRLNAFQSNLNYRCAEKATISVATEN
jgi:hypothetical protein